MVQRKSGPLPLDGRQWLRASVLLAMASCALSACVTINIYFPAAAAEKAADKIIDEVWQMQGKPSEDKQPIDSTKTQTGK
jgi:uncharacterized protein